MHIPVLLHESIDGLDIHENDIYVDGTLGSAGHSSEVAKRFKEKVSIIGFDRDEDALVRSEKKLKALGANFVLEHTSFHEIKKVVTHADRILLDLGISSNQLEESGRGFTFLKDEPLLMTMKKENSDEDTTAYDIANFWREENIIAILKGYGEEKWNKRIANGIVLARKEGEIKTTGQLAEIIKASVPGFYRNGKIHPATKTFQAFRIAVNNELGILSEGLENCFEVLKSGGRIAVISFHSLEDRIVKDFFKKIVLEEKAIAITKKPIIESAEILKTNPRARSAKLRIIQKI